MKVEAVCTAHSEQCPTVIAVDAGGGEFRHVQLVEVAKVRVLASTVDDRRHNPSNGVPVDDEGNIAECMHCGCALLVTNMSSEDAVLALGKIVFSPGVLALFHMDVEEPHEADKATFTQITERWVKCHRRGDWGSLSSEDAAVQRQALKIHADGQAEGIVMSSWFFNREKVWMITERGRHVTTVLLPGER